MSYEYLMQALLLLIIVILTFGAMMLWTRWSKKK